MQLVEDKSFMPVSDPLKMQDRLSELENEFKSQGHQVKRKALGIVVLKLADGEVHFVPGNGEIRRLIFQSSEHSKGGE